MGPDKEEIAPDDQMSQLDNIESTLDKIHGGSHEKDAEKEKAEEDSIMDDDGGAGGDDEDVSLENEMEGEAKVTKKHKKKKVQPKPEEKEDQPELVQSIESEKPKPQANSYLQTKTYLEQKQLITKINDIFGNKKLDAIKKLKQFTSEVCLPEILKSNNSASVIQDDIFLNVSNQKDKKVIPYVCFFNGLNFL